jgi:hypothetical protein
MSYSLASLLQYLELTFGILVSFALGISINKQDFLKYPFVSINKVIYGVVVVFFLSAFAYLHWVGGNQDLFLSLLLVSGFGANIWWKSGNEFTRKATAASLANGFVLLAAVCVVGRPYFLKASSGIIFFILLILGFFSSVLLAQLAIWFVNRFLSTYKTVAIVTLLVLVFIVSIVVGKLIEVQPAIMAAVAGYISRNTIFSTSYRKDLSNAFKDPFMKLFIWGAIFAILLYQSQLSLSAAYAIIGATIGASLAFFIFKNKIHFNDGFYSIGFVLLLTLNQLTEAGILSLIAFVVLASAGLMLIYQQISNNKGIYINELKQHQPEVMKQESKLFSGFLQDSFQSRIQDFSYAGYKYGCEIPKSFSDQFKTYSALDFGIQPDLKEDQLTNIQFAINEIGKAGGGVLFFPAGEYHLNMSAKNTNFLKINYSNVFLRGEIVSGKNKSIIVSHQHTLIGNRNPWLSPFLITYGYDLQKSNLFWGLQFKNKKDVKTRSNSLTDPGSDGTIQTPEYCCNILADAFKGDRFIKVENTKKLAGVKYILIGQYNTTTDGNLLKSMLNRDTIPHQWKTALRGGPEKAPSYQWLVEIEEVVDEQTLLLSQPVRKDILLTYEPEIYYVPMVENVGIEDITFKCNWSGMFRHHGAPIYFSTRQSQIMDYGWNAVNFCRVAHGFMRNVEIINFTNPLYIQDSRNLTIEQVSVSGHDGHQGIKLYGHSCDNLMKNITFQNHYADMIGGEGNCYGNVFSGIRNVNAENKPVDFDFHGFSEGPFSPPSYTLFENCEGFRGVKASGTLYNQPACALDNIWWNISGEGYDSSTEIFKHDQYKRKPFLRTNFSAAYRATIYCLQRNTFSLSAFMIAYREKRQDIVETGWHRYEHYKLFKNSIIVSYSNKHYPLSIDKKENDHDNDSILMEYLNAQQVFPLSLYAYQLEARKSHTNGADKNGYFFRLIDSKSATIHL